MSNKGILGGTFDTLHDGHKALLNTAFSEGDHVRVGLTSDILANQSRKRDVKSYDKRYEELLDVCKTYSNIYNTEFEIVKIENAYGTSVSIEADFIAISPEKKTKKRTKKINEIRQSEGMDKLRVIETPHVKDYEGERISSTKIRSGEINRHGESI